MKYLPQLFCLNLCLIIAACTTPNPEFGSTNGQGLTPITNSNFDQLLIRTDTDFKQYQRIKVEPPIVSYKKHTSADLGIYRQQDFQFDEAELKTFNEQFIKAFGQQWQQRFGWQVTDESGEDVLVVKTEISDLYLYASIKNDKPMRSTTIVNESSKMTIKLQLFDNSGQLLVDSLGDKTTGQIGSGVNTMTRVSSVRYWNDCYQAFRQWASLLAGQISASQP